MTEPSTPDGCMPSPFQPSRIRLHQEVELLNGADIRVLMGYQDEQDGTWHDKRMVIESVDSHGAPHEIAWHVEKMGSNGSPESMMQSRFPSHSTGQSFDCDWERNTIFYNVFVGMPSVYGVSLANHWEVFHALSCCH